MSRMECLPALAVAWAAAAGGAAAQERKLGELPEDVALELEPVVGPDGVEIRATSRLAWSRDFSTFAVVGRRIGKTHVVTAAGVGDPFDYVDPPVIASTGRADDAPGAGSRPAPRILFRVGNRLDAKREKWWPLVDGRKGGAEDWIGAIGCDSAGRRLAYWTQPGARIGRDGAYERGAMVLAVVDAASGKAARGAKWDDALSLEPPQFSADGAAVATAASRDGKWHALLVRKKEEVASGPFAFLREIAIRPDGGAVAVSAADAVSPGTPRPDLFVAVGEARFGERYDAALTPRWSGDSKLLAWVVRKDGKSGVYVGEANRVNVEWEWIADIALKHDGSDLACIVNRGGTVDEFSAALMRGVEPAGGEWFLLRDSKLQGPFEAIEQLLWSPDGRHLAFAARRAGKWIAFLDTTESIPCDDVAGLVFSSDSQRVAFGARLGRALWRKEIVRR